jgi:hypothetical protein
MPVSRHTATEAAERLERLAACRVGSLIAAAAVVALVLAHDLRPGAAGIGLAAAVVTGGATHVARMLLLERLVLREDLCDLPAIDAARRRLVAPAHRRELADELERADAVHPRTVVEVTRLLTDGGRSPLWNAAVEEGELEMTLRRIRFQLASARKVSVAATPRAGLSDRGLPGARPPATDGV